MIDATTAIIIVGLLAIGYAVRELDPNARTPEQAEREADEARREQQARQERRRGDLVYAQRTRWDLPN